MIEDFIEYEAFRPLLEDAVICPECDMGVLCKCDIDPQRAICDVCDAVFEV
ncbi:MAG: hypothetical protein HON92_04655 [Planctomycetaceae bacterium]|jgi:hypothetical protein|nr:hypothetical protein [Planctomycetaceae bacterium]